MLTINPYLNFKGNAEEAFLFYKTVFNGEIINIQRFKDTPESGRIPAHEADKMMHIAMKIGNTTLMATDAMESMGHKISVGTNFHLNINPESKEEADRIFKALSVGGLVTIPIEKMFWGAYFGMVTDKFDIQWMVNYEEKPVS